MCITRLSRVCPMAVVSVQHTCNSCLPACVCYTCKLHARIRVSYTYSQLLWHTCSTRVNELFNTRALDAGSTRVHACKRPESGTSNTRVLLTSKYVQYTCVALYVCTCARRVSDRAQYTCNTRLSKHVYCQMLSVNAKACSVMRLIYYFTKVPLKVAYKRF